MINLRTCDGLTRSGHAGPPHLRTQEVGLDLLATAINEYAIFMVDLDGRVASWNPGAERLKGYRSDEIIGQHISVFYPPERLAEKPPEWELEHAARTGYHQGEGWRVRKDGSRFWAHVVTAALRSSDGSLRGYAKVVRDDTEPRARLERSSERFTNLMGLTPVGIALFDESHRLARANDALCDLLGAGISELHDTRANDLLHPQDRLEPMISRAPIADAPTHRVLKRTDSHPVHCDLRCTAAVQDDGRLFWLVAFQDITERHQRAEELHYQATHDSLTGLFNRRAVNELLNELVRGPRADRVGVLFCDIDNFKRINDSLGHDAGDELVASLARRLQGGVPAGCTPARLSGDEFVVVCPDVEAVGGLEALAETVSGLLRTVVRLQNQQVQVSAAVGGAVLDGAGAYGEDLLRFADAAMYRAKRHGPGRVALADPGLAESINRQLRLEVELRDAIDNDGLVLHYQPVVDAAGTVVSAEALVRWMHPEHGLLPPDVFLPVAEQGGLMRDLDRWVLRTALRHAAAWPDVGGRPVGIAVNLAGLLPDDHGFTAEVTDAIAESGIDPNRVVLELVETVLVDLPPQPRRAMLDLVERGVQFAVDDFGTGYSSLARIKDLPAQIIKADRSFVADLGAGSRDLAVARAVADLARALGCQSIAEGIETAEQFELLRGVGIDVYQGFLFARPVPEAELIILLENGLPLLSRATGASVNTASTTA
ncbi:putative bifunctional diguanylate cyclase/phosphodiesterase [Saccharopolyspora spinosa]|uniref:Diguanylate cyclase/phosphodiesterase with PAS/PAC sensor(S) n=1 Tax=Saccharopolyspora spinosa TaxID=60894 RepID=A0A2N3Y237_SACSN|nr:EAL domain-containing protein [Saccharopolyspora spinosa]PKW16988.1 diguanylate cyclase/phosphodiesterase with PAS/PAC sensor(s) [Saccharopolyspora spinosa]